MYWSVKSKSESYISQLSDMKFSIFKKSVDKDK